MRHEIGVARVVAEVVKSEPPFKVAQEAVSHSGFCINQTKCTYENYCVYTIYSIFDIYRALA